MGFDFAKAFGCPTRVVNDAAMQALGGYWGGRMLFLGLGTGLGSAPDHRRDRALMELAHLPYKKGTHLRAVWSGPLGLKRLGRKRWSRHVLDVTERLKAALGADYVVLGGGNAKLLKELPPDVRLGNNSQAFLGGFRLWKPAAKRRQ